MSNTRVLYRILGLFVAMLCVPAIGVATTRFVDASAGADVGACDVSPCLTIEYTISQSGAGDVIRVTAGTYLENPMTISTNLVIKGDTAFNTVIDGQGSGPIFTINADRVVLKKLTLQNGDAGTNNGGAIALTGGNLTLTKCRLLDNNAQNGGAIADSSSGKLLISASTLQGNNASIDGGGIWCDACGNFSKNVTLLLSQVAENSAGRWGGGVYIHETQGPARFILSSLSQNTADSGGAVYAEFSIAHVLDSDVSNNVADNGDAGGIYINGFLNIERSTFAENSASTNGGAVVVYGSSGLTSANSTFSQNSALCGGALYLLENMGVGPFAVIANATFYGNQAGFVACGQHIVSTAFTSLELSNSILAGSAASACTPGFPATGGSHNLLDDNSCDTGGANFNLGPVTGLDSNLAFNGGLTRTHKLIYDLFSLPPVVSNAVDAGKNSKCVNPWFGTSLVLDQRGKKRPVDHIPVAAGGVATCDIGAVELGTFE